MTKFLASAFPILFALMASAQADDDAGLYGKPLPKDAAFVRALGFEAGEAPDAYGTSLSDDGNYAVVLAEETVGIDAGDYVTVLPNATVLHDPKASRAKVQIGVFNAGYGGAVALKTADGKIEIAIADTDGAGFREVNPLVLMAAIFDGPEMLGDPYELHLRRDENPTFLVHKDGTYTVYVSTVIWDE